MARELQLFPELAAERSDLANRDSSVGGRECGSRRGENSARESRSNRGTASGQGVHGPEHLPRVALNAGHTLAEEAAIYYNPDHAGGAPPAVCGEGPPSWFSRMLRTMNSKTWSPPSTPSMI